MHPNYENPNYENPDQYTSRSKMPIIIIRPGIHVMLLH